jgi:glucose-1-phosphate cytidylyltransferase
VSQTQQERIPVIILCGGLGTRLREETEYRPKPMVEIGGRPILWHIMRLYAHFGFKEFILCLGYKGMMIKEYFLNYQPLVSDFKIRLGEAPSVSYLNGRETVDWSVTLADTGLDAMTGARVKRVEKYIETPRFMLTYGDGLASIDIAALVRFHRTHAKLVTVTGVRPPSRFGEMSVRTDGVVDRFDEKPQISEGMVNGGFFVCERGFFEYLSDDETCVLEQEPLRRVATDGQLAAYDHEGFWQCMDTYREWQMLTKLWESDSAPWKVWS